MTLITLSLITQTGLTTSEGRHMRRIAIGLALVVCLCGLARVGYSADSIETGVPTKDGIYEFKLKLGRHEKTFSALHAKGTSAATKAQNIANLVNNSSHWKATVSGNTVTFYYNRAKVQKISVVKDYTGEPDWILRPGSPGAVFEFGLALDDDLPDAIAAAGLDDDNKESFVSVTLGHDYSGARTIIADATLPIREGGNPSGIVSQLVEQLVSDGFDIRMVSPTLFSATITDSDPFIKTQVTDVNLVSMSSGTLLGIIPGGALNDDQFSILYNPGSGELALNVPSGQELVGISIKSSAAIFAADSAQNIGGAFEISRNDLIFKAVFADSFGSLSFGNVAQCGLDEDFLLEDLVVRGVLAGGGSAGIFDLIYSATPDCNLNGVPDDKVVAPPGIPGTQY